MQAELMEIGGLIALKTPRGTIVFEGVIATRLATAMEESARWGVSKEGGDPDRLRVLTFPIHQIIDPDPDTAHGEICAAETRKGSWLARDSGSDAGGGDG